MQTFRKIYFLVFGGCLFTFFPSILDAQVIDLGDVVGGGDGSGNAPAANIGVDPRNGQFATFSIDNTLRESDLPQGDGLNPSPVAGSTFIDSVFFIGDAANPPMDDPFEQIITQSNVVYSFPLLDGIGTGWNHILKNSNGGELGLPITIGGLDTFTSGIGIHSSTGITFDLNALRTTHGAGQVGCFSTFWGMDACGGDVILYAILSNDAGILDTRTFNATSNSGEPMDMLIPAEARYLTLATGSNGLDGCDHGTFGAAIITPAPCAPQPAVSLAITPSPVSLSTGGSAQLKVLGLTAQGSPSDLTSAASGTTYSAAPAGIVSVSADGLVKALAVGQAEVTAQNGALSAKVNATILGSFIDLGSIVAGGNGKNSPPAGNIGIDVRNGQFAKTSVDATVRETDVPEGDGLNPSPAATSILIDSVFFIGDSTLPPATDPFEQAITSSNVEFQFPAADGIGTGWNHILANANGGETGPILVGGKTYNSAVGIHASTGVTFDLRNIRSTHGANNVGCFTTIWGMDACGGNVMLYAILSNDTDGILKVDKFNATQNSGAFLLTEIPASAIYLTLATGSNGIDGCDHGTFAEAKLIPGPCTLPPILSLAVTPAQANLPPGQTLQLSVKANLENGFTTDVTRGSAGTTYTVDPAGIVTVDSDGLVTALVEGVAVVTAANGGLTAKATIVTQEFVDLGNIAAGGDGKLPPPAGNIGIDADTAVFATARIGAEVIDTNLINPQPVDGTNGASTSPYLDSVFLMDLGAGQIISTKGVTFDFAAGDEGPGWEEILNGREPGGPDYLELGAAGRFDRGVGLHASQGITFNLQRLRTIHGAAKVKFISAVAGEGSGEAGGNVNAYMIVSDDIQVLDWRAVRGATDRGELIQMPVPDVSTFKPLYLTLAVGAAGDGNGGDHGAFGLARLTASAVDTSSISALQAVPERLALIENEEAQLSIYGLLTATGLQGVPVAVDPATCAFSSDQPEFATVDASGKVKAVGHGLATITVTKGAFSDTVMVRAGRYIELADVTAGGDGHGTAPAENIGIDPRNGNFATVSIDNTIRETDPEGDGVNPSPCADSNFVDSVFFIGPATGDPFDQKITQSNVVYQFPRTDGIATGWNHILANANGGELGPVLVGGRIFPTAVGIHASTGITFDLKAMRQAHGAGAAEVFSTTWGMDACTGDVILYTILSKDGGILDARTFHALQNSGEYLEVNIPAEADYLTLATGSNGADGCDHGTFAEARIFGSASGIPPRQRFRRGDLDSSGAVDISDPINGLHSLFLGDFTITCQDAADFDDSGEVDISDMINSLLWQFASGSIAPLPGPFDCGEDPTPDKELPDIGCGAYTAACQP